MSNERSILIVDSNEGFAMMLKQSLEQQGGGYRATVATNGNKALQAIASTKFDLAVVDLGLTDPDGTTLVRQMRQRQPDLRLMLIPFEGDDLPADLKDVSVQGILPKPFFLPELPERINDALAKFVGQAAPPAPSQDLDVVKEPERITVQPVKSELPASSGELLTRVRRHIQDIVRRMSTLAQEVNADVALLTSGRELIAHTGRLSAEEASGLADTVADSWRTSARVAQILGLEQSQFEQSTEGGEHLFYSLTVADEIVLSVAVRASVPLGMIRHRTKSAADALRTLIGV